MQMIYSSVAFALLNAQQSRTVKERAENPLCTAKIFSENRKNETPKRNRQSSGSQHHHHNPHTDPPPLTVPNNPAQLVRRQDGTPTSALLTSAETGVFTVPGAGSYEVTYLSNAYDVAGHVLTVGGGDALVGGVIVTAASSGFVANGQIVELAPITSSTSSTLAAAQTTETTSRTKSVGTPTVTASETSSAGGAMVTGRIGAAVLGDGERRRDVLFLSFFFLLCALMTWEERELDHSANVRVNRQQEWRI
ncbi:uncharacterized protein MYCFIDRAFT_177097 [Pseudocercospora fijiensis CIRAD86]|uniref:Uncharacterized protein n=1 Tax=Pseudocercospora fijiensis (strain CIRAD86) TaxID=383855 RepID=M2YQX7_PSEFD|nr:uncharacterized protein MYCFIDRAFT_177097 [Pseudocercospora fijiensis CIRAD86]EME80120.1 hypothetical protein MYCFIDRAFT_177097 [Pseudocercospora fijiensis CIRAD86]